MKKLHRYIAENFLFVFFTVLVFTVFLFILSDFFTKLGVILKSSVPVKYVLEYYFFYTPFVVYFSLPFIFGLSVVISLGYMSFRNEIIVMRSSGLSIFKIAFPVFVISIIVALVMFLSKELFVNYGLDRASLIKQYYFKNEKNSSVWLKVGNLFISARGIDVRKKLIYGVVAYRVDNSFSRFLKVLQSKKAEFLKNKLVFENGYWSSVPSGSKHRFERFIVKNKRPFVSLIAESKFKEPSLRTLFRELKSAKDRNYYLSMILFRFLYPLSCVLLTLISLVFVLRITPRKSGFISNVFLSGVVFLTFIATFQVVITMGKYSMIEPVFSIAIFMLFWIAVSLYNLVKLGI